MLLASRFVADAQYRVCLMVIALCLFLVAPCHLVPLPLNKYGKFRTSIHLGISLLLSTASAWIKPGIILPAVIVEIPTLFCLIKYQVFQRICRFLERQQKVAAYKKVAEPVGWMHYPTEWILETSYYFLVFLVFGISFYRTTESTFILIAFTILAVACLFLCAVWITSILVFNQEMILRIFAWKCREYGLKDVKEIRYGRLRWKLSGAACGATLRIAGTMTGDMLQMLSLFKKRIVRQHQDG